mmetsp:Transcript_40571/g.114897  ORF Transcript_40571/g.114897 Transcript_40571/m.114897 type:complete len:542 (+) Transcript_40571:171-1796(+)
MAPARRLVAIISVAFCWSQLLLQVAGHCACAPCLCELVSNKQVAQVAQSCAKGYETAEIATNRTLQLLRSLSRRRDDIANCDLQGQGLQNTIDDARSSFEQTVLEAYQLRKQLLGSSTSTRPAEDYGQRIQERLEAVSALALSKSESIADGLGEVLQDCFQELPVAAAVTRGAPLSSQDGSALAASTPPPVTLSDENNVGLAWGLTALSALSTLLGAGLVGFATPGNLLYLSFLEAFTAGVMLQGSLTGLSTQAALLTVDRMHPTAAFWAILLCFFGGAGICVLLEVVSHRFLGHASHSIPGLQETPAAAKAASLGPGTSETEASFPAICAKAEAEVELGQGHKPEAASAGTWQQGSGSANSSASDEEPEMAASSNGSGGSFPPGKVQPSVFVVIAGVTLHNVAEGMATFTAALTSSRLGIGLAVAMVLHNIPEGISIALPYYHASGSRLRGFLWAALSGGAEILAGLLVYLLYLFSHSSVQQTAFACMFAVASGMMTYIALYELYPSALAAAGARRAVPGSGLFLGLLVMQLTLGQLGLP